MRISAAAAPSCYSRRRRQSELVAQELLASRFHGRFRDLPHAQPADHVRCHLPHLRLGVVTR
eukprot:1557733-Pyramimonas_sp.AAC.1